jgi:hypothetical protein
MTHTRLTPPAEVLRRDKSETVRADEAVQSGGEGKETGVEATGVPQPPADMSLLVHQLYSLLKRELKVERERKGGIY